jgi:uncharacterized small protein (DUF1192 family)
MLSAELDHFLQVERDIAQMADVEANMETARHEHQLANDFVFETDSEEIAELAKLDEEIARLEMILERKMAEHSAEYSSSYAEDSAEGIR